LAAIFGDSDDAVERKYLWPKLFMLWNYVSLQIVAATENERLFSLAKMIETARRSGLENDVLISLMRIADYGPTPSDFSRGPLIEKVIDIWYASKERMVDLGPQKKSVVENIPIEIRSSISSGKRFIDKSLAPLERQDKPVWSFSGGKYNEDVKKISRETADTSRKRKIMADGNSLYDIPLPIPSIYNAPATLGSTSSKPASTSAGDLQPKSFLMDHIDDKEDSDALELLREKQNEAERRFKSRIEDLTTSIEEDDDDMELSVGKLIAVENEEEAAAKAVQQNLKRKKAAALKKLHIDAVVQPPEVLPSTDPYYDNSTKNRTSRYKPSAKALENLFS